MKSIKVFARGYALELYWIIFKFLLTATLLVLFIFYTITCLGGLPGNISIPIPVIVRINQYILVTVLSVSVLLAVTFLIDFIRYRSINLFSFSCSLFGLGLVYAFDAGKYRTAGILAILGLGTAVYILKCIIELLHTKSSMNRD